MIPGGKGGRKLAGTGKEGKSQTELLRTRICNVRFGLRKCCSNLSELQPCSLFLALFMMVCCTVPAMSMDQIPNLNCPLTSTRSDFLQ